MKRKFLLLTLLVFLGLNLYAQKNNLVVFSEQGERFYLILNGVRQNTSPETNVKVVDLNQPSYKLKVIFEDRSIPDMDKGLTFLESGKEMVVSIATKKGKRKFRLVSEAAIINNGQTSSEQKLIYYGAPADTARTITTTTTTTTTTTNNPVNTTTGTNNTSTTSGSNVNVSNNTTTTGVTNTSGSNISINVNENGLSVTGTGMNINMSGTTTSQESSSTSSVNTSGSSTSTMGNDNSSKYLANGTFCASPSVTSDVFVKTKFQLSERTLVTRMNYTKDFVKKNCMQASQVAELVNLFEYDSDQLELAKFCYQYTYDSKNYDVVVKSLKRDYDRADLLNTIGTNASGTSSTINPSNSSSTTTVVTTTVVEEKKTVAPVNSTQGSASGCYTPISDAEFKTSKESISSKGFEDTKLTVAKQVMKNKCLKVSHIKEIMGLFGFEETRLDFAKAAYDYAYDKDNYYQLNDAFHFDASVEELATFIESKK